MRQYSDEEIGDLISCPKVISDPPKRHNVLEGGHNRNDMKLTSEGGDKVFSVFMRINVEFPENFSIGLVYHPKDERGTLTLIRMNGPHGEFLTSSGVSPDSHCLYHCHLAKPSNIQSGRLPEWGGDPVTCYASYEQALYCFLSVANIRDADIHFPKYQEPTLFNMDEG